MSLHGVENLYFKIVDAFFARMPRAIPSKKRLRRITVFSHRGECDNNRLLENSMAAFEAACAAGVGGLEFDVRWTKDLVPVVFHDPDLKRIYSSPKRIGNIAMADLRREFPEIPSLEEVVAAFGRRLHLMIELKKENFPNPAKQRFLLAKLLGVMDAGQDYHLISLTPEIFKIFSGFPPKSYVPIVRINARPFSRLSIDESYGGIAGHYTFIGNARINRHRRRLQRVGTGFIHSRNSLFREVNRGIDWIFSNHAAWLQKLVNDLLGVGQK